MRARGLSHAEIAQQLQVSRASISSDMQTKTAMIIENESNISEMPYHLASMNNYPK
jgi:transcriptional regulator